MSVKKESTPVKESKRRCSSCGFKVRATFAKHEEGFHHKNGNNGHLKISMKT